MRTSIWFRIFLNHPVYQFAMFIDTRMLCLFARGGNLRVGQVDCHRGHFVRYSKCWAPCVLPMFLPWFYTLLHIVYHIFPCFTMFYQCFYHVFSCPVFLSFNYRSGGFQSPATTEVGPATRRKNSRLSTDKMGPGKPVGKVGWVGCFQKIVVPPNHSILIGFSIINHPFWGTPIFGNIQFELHF